MTMKVYLADFPRHFLGDLVALMGPSGSGKTTLLNILAKRIHLTNTDVEATVLVNGRTMSANEFQNISSYVEQEDILIGSLTVRETLGFAARLAPVRYVSVEALMPTTLIMVAIVSVPNKHSNALLRA